MKILFLILVFCACQAFVQGRSREELQAMRDRARGRTSGLGGDDDDSEVVDHLQQCKGLETMESMEDKDKTCKEIFKKIDRTAKTFSGDRDEKNRAKTFALNCLRDDTALVERLRGTGNSMDYYLEEFANLQVTKARTYLETSRRTYRDPLDSNVKEKMFLRLVPAELREALQKSDFPVAKNDDDDAKKDNREAAYKVLRIACGSDDESDAWTEVEAKICTSNWGAESSSTVQNIFKASMIDTYTKFALDDKEKGYKVRVQQSKNLEELEKRWKKVTEIVRNIGTFANRTQGLKNICLDDDTPETTKTRIVFKRLAAMARQLAPSDAGDNFCPNADKTIQLSPYVGISCSDGVGGGPQVDGMEKRKHPQLGGPR